VRDIPRCTGRFQISELRLDKLLALEETSCSLQQTTPQVRSAEFEDQSEGPEIWLNFSGPPAKGIPNNSCRQTFEVTSARSSLVQSSLVQSSLVSV
jgi:hypothetical protein